jgi:hypothetical protein
METINIRKCDLEILIDGFSDWAREDRSSRDYCRFCGKIYGNVTLMEKRGDRITHNKDCPVLVAQDLSTGL